MIGGSSKFKNDPDYSLNQFTLVTPFPKGNFGKYVVRQKGQTNENISNRKPTESRGIFPR